MRHTRRFAFLAVVLLAAATAAWAAEAEKAAGAEAEKAAGAEADKAAEAAKVFESLYGSDVKRVGATADPKDDLDLAARLVAAADQAKGQPEFYALVLESAATLAAASPDGYETAVRALDALAAEVPSRGPACADRVVDIRQKQYDAARPADRAAAGEHLIEALVAVADLKAASDAAAVLRRAQAVARAVKGGRQDEIEARLQRLAQAQKVEQQIADLKTVLEKTPDNPAAREKLVRLYLVDLDDPAEAAKYVDGLADASLAKCVPEAARGVEAATELACAELGDWYRGLGEAAAAGSKAAMFARAKACYERFLDLHADEDLPRTAAALALKKVEAELERLGGAPATPGAAAGVIRPGRWVDLAPLVSLPQHADGGQWSKQGPWLVCAPEGPKMRRIVLPVRPEGDYEFEVRLVATPGLLEAFPALALPGGHELLVVVCQPKSELGLEHIDEKNWVQNGTRVSLPERLVLGKEYAVLCRVLRRGPAAVRVEVAFQGKPLTAWEGAVSRLRPGSPNLAFGVWDSPGTFSGVRLRMLSGEAKAAPAGAKPGPTSGRTPLAAPLRQGLVLCYTFDKNERGKVADLSGCGNHGKVQGAQWTSEGKVAGAYRFEAARKTQGILVPNTESLGVKRLTMAAWIRTTQQDGTWARIMDKDWRNGYNLCLGGDNKGNQWRGQAGVEINSHAVFKGRVADGQWHHVLATYDGRVQRLYIDAAPVGQAAWAGDIGINPYDLAVGNSSIPYGTGELLAFDGLIDEAMIWNRALSAEEVRQVYEATGGKADAAAVMLEGEAMRILGATGGKTALENMTTFKGTWTGSAQLWWSKAKPGDRLDLVVPVEAAGTYRLKVAMTKASDYAIVQLYLDGKPVGAPIDLYDPQVVPTGEIDLGTRNLTAGEHRLGIGIVGANPAAAKAYMAGLDHVRLEPAQP